MTDKYVHTTIEPWEVDATPELLVEPEDTDTASVDASVELPTAELPQFDFTPTLPTDEAKEPTIKKGSYLVTMAALSALSVAVTLAGWWQTKDTPARQAAKDAQAAADQAKRDGVRGRDLKRLQQEADRTARVAYSDDRQRQHKAELEEHERNMKQDHRNNASGPAGTYRGAY